MNHRPMTDGQAKEILEQVGLTGDDRADIEAHGLTLQSVAGEAATTRDAELVGQQMEIL